ncbi:hypothetical protein A2210_01195 [Candidatus Woesebacteria bacterium RIFOXYA1_FULL_40_18]|uniref:site-specific DNA-methyltransferase (adenine-specific) n=2 Tax=Candidatus Woeseibacteriota TaxID=1752722 RepID=A0A1F8CLC6_9BACT|nr:MAG: hypothetical protein A2210_01195 [Candidatus Woesebacteria bacterium RIFOXYA1_FULL_40_18]OGM81715.1 MAG: hypothetical protein A2361_00590 [Candidatus Woesebacteria bacterium RIFOXYB1_FULL_40_26]
MTKDEAKQKTQELIEKYEKVKLSRSTSKYTEEETKKGFIEPLFEALGWDLRNKDEVSAEESLSSGRPDYGFYLDGRLKFYLEAKPLKSDLHRVDLANQAVRYSWNKGATWAILTDFESLKVFNAQVIDRSLSDKLFYEISYSQYLERFDQLWLLSKEAFKDNLLDKDAEAHGKKLQRISVTDKLYKDLNECREILTHDLALWNKDVDKDLLDEGVQKLLDRLIFLRVAEDRGIEPPTLIPLIRDWENDGGKKHLYESMIQKFREFDAIYNSNLFSEHPFEKWGEYSGATEKVIEILYGKPGYYEYNFKAMPADVLGGIYENYLGYRLEKSRKGLSVSKDAKKRKESGIYYTPDFIVDYIVKNTLKPVLDNCKSIEDLKKIKVLDPACGSGSFLIKALEVIHAKYIEFGSRGGIWTKLDILLNNIYGVDLDSQAVEIARLNLLINALDTRMKLPSLAGNIKNGNSLISGTDEELKKYFGKDFRDKKPFNWKEEFPEVFKQGGFDVIVGNPPYGADLDNADKKYFSFRSLISEYQLDTYILFIDLSNQLLRSSGILGMILPNTWLTNINVDKLRQFLVSQTTLLEITNFSRKIFTGATVDNVVLIFEKNIPKQSHKLKLNLISEEGERSHKINQSSWINQKVFNINVTDIERLLVQKIENGTIPLEKICKVTVGIKPYQVGKGNPVQDREIVTNRIFDSDKQKDNTYRPYLRGRNINRYVVNPDPKQWISYGKWLAEPRDVNLFDDNKKIIIRQTGDSLVAALDDVGFLCLNNMHTINIKNKNYDIGYLLGLINSSLLNYYFQYLNPEKGEALAEVKATNVKRLPIKEVSRVAQKGISDLTQVVLDLHKKTLKVVENSEKWKSIKSEIEKTDKKINDEVYKLYGLTEGEIKIVENGL